jgi:putative tryptophan/tyrosine transport system substrate-binding protein
VISCRYCMSMTPSGESRGYIGRRELVGALCGAAATWPFAVRAQRPAMSVIGFLNGGSVEGYAHAINGFHQGLKETGYVVGENAAIEYRWALGEYDRLPALAADLVLRQVCRYRRKRHRVR